MSGMKNTLIQQERIIRGLSQLAPEVPAIAVCVVDETGSTNADLLQQVRQASGPMLLLANRQVAGHGRAGRRWDTDGLSALTFSLAWPMSMPYVPGSLSLAVGVALAETLCQLGVAVQLKWPNDMLRDGAKLAGILVETVRDKGLSWSVTGVGLNLSVNAAVTSRLGRALADVSELSTDTEDLVAHLAAAMAKAMVQYNNAGFAPFVPRWEALHAYAGQRVVLLEGGQVVQSGVATGIDADGRLLLATASGTIAVATGDVSLRLDPTIGE